MDESRVGRNSCTGALSRILRVSKEVIDAGARRERESKRQTPRRETAQSSMAHWFLALGALLLCGCDAWAGFQVENTLSQSIRVEAGLERPYREKRPITTVLGPGETSEEIGFVTGGADEWSGYLRAYSVTDGRLVSERRWVIKRVDGPKYNESCRFQVLPGIQPTEPLPCLPMIPIEGTPIPR